MAIVAERATGIKNKTCQKPVPLFDVVIKCLKRSLTLSTETTTVWQHLLHLGFHLSGAVLFSEQAK